MSSCMPKEQQEYLDNLTNYVLEATNMSESEAKDFAFRIWQCKDSDEFKRLVFNHPLFPHCKRLMKRIVMQSECIEELNDQLSRYCEWEMEQVMARQNPPLKFEELKEGMWVWDNTANWYNYITELLTIRDKNHIKFDDGCRSYFMVDFEEGRFFAREVKE